MQNRRTISILAGGICALSLAMGVSRFGFTPIIPIMQRDIGLAEWDIAVLASANYLGYLAGAWASRRQYVTGHVRGWLGGGLAGSILLLAAMPATQLPALWTLLRLSAGFLSAILFVIASSITLGQGRSNRAGYLYSGVGIGLAFTGICVPVFDAIGGWKGTWLGLALGGSIFGAIAWRMLAKEAGPEPVHSELPRPESRFTRDYAWYALLVAYGLEGIGYIITATYIVQMLGAIPELRQIANQSWVFIGLAAIPSTYLWARFAQKTNIRIALMLAYSLQALGILMPVVLPNQVSTLAGGVLFGGTFMGITSLAIALACRMKAEAKMKAIAELTTAFALGQIIGPIAAAYLQKNFDLLAPSIFAVVVLLFALLALATINKKVSDE